MASLVYQHDDWLKKLCNFIVDSYRKLRPADRVVAKTYKKFKSKQTVEGRKLNLPDYSDEEDGGIDVSDLIRARIYDFSDLRTIRKFKHIIKTKAGEILCTNVLKIALIDLEEKVASVLLSEYKVKMEEEIIIRAIVIQKFEFLYWMWKFHK